MEVLSDFWRLNSSSFVWEHISYVAAEHKKLEIDSYPPGRYGHTMQTYYDYIFMFGGINSQGQYFSR